MSVTQTSGYDSLRRAIVKMLDWKSRPDSGRLVVGCNFPYFALRPEQRLLDVSWQKSAADPTAYCFGTATPFSLVVNMKPAVWLVKDPLRDPAVRAVGTHTLRHTYRTWLSSEGASLDVQRRLMWHSDIKTTMNLYGHLSPDEMKGSQSRTAGRVVN